MPSIAFHGTVNINMGGLQRLQNVTQQLLALQNSMNQQQPMLEQNIITNHKHQEINSRAAMERSFVKRQNPIFMKPRLGSRSSGQYALKDFTDHLHEYASKLSCSEVACRSWAIFAWRKRMANFLTFLAEEALDLEAWTSFKVRLESAMENKWISLSKGCWTLWKQLVAVFWVRI